MALVVETTVLPGVLIVTPKRFEDPRGFFMQTYHKAEYQAAGIPAHFVQDNMSRSCRGTLRGLHYQLKHPQAKLVSVTQGAVRDIVVDIRVGSPHFGQWVAVHLSAENHRQLFVPEGFAHGFQVLSDTADFTYKCGDFYTPGDEYGIRWNDPDILIEWDSIDAPVISAKDEILPFLADVPQENLPAYRP